MCVLVRAFVLLFIQSGIPACARMHECVSVSVCLSARVYIYVCVSACVRACVQACVWVYSLLYTLEGFRLKTR